MNSFNTEDLNQLWKPEPGSHKGQNGRVLVIGGSKLFHASIFWAADAASKYVDLIHFTSPANENNEVVRTKIKEGFWSGVVVDWGDVDYYVNEDDCILIGPGMPRPDGLMEGEESTAEIVNKLLSKYPDKKWVVDGGALQEVDPTLLNNNHIVTPHFGEFKRLVDNTHDEFLISNFEFLNNNQWSDDQISRREEYLKTLSNRLNGVTILLKGVVDVVCRGDETVVVEGGNEGMTKGGTGDVLAGLVAAFYAKNDPLLAACAASFVNKKAGESLYGEFGPNFAAGDLVGEVPKVLHKLLET